MVGEFTFKKGGRECRYFTEIDIYNLNGKSVKILSYQLKNILSKYINSSEQKFCRKKIKFTIPNYFIWHFNTISINLLLAGLIIVQFSSKRIYYK